MKNNAESGGGFISNIRELGVKGIYNKYGMILVFIFVFAVASIISPQFLKGVNLTNILRQLVVVTLLAFGETFIILLGHIDVSVGSVVALTGCLACTVVNETHSVVLGVLTACALGAAIGLIDGLVVTRYKIQAFVVTLAMTTIARGIVLLYTNGVPVTDLGDDFKLLGQGSIGFMPISIIILILFFILSWMLLNRTKFGRHVYATGGNVLAARASGIKVNKVVQMAFIYSGFLSGAAGVLLMSRINSGQPAIGVGYEFDAITAVVVGGTSLSGGVGSIFGTIIGALIIGVINNVLNLMNVNSYWQDIVRGVIIALAVIVDVKTKNVKIKKKIS